MCESTCVQCTMSCFIHCFLIFFHRNPKKSLQHQVHRFRWILVALGHHIEGANFVFVDKIVRTKLFLTDDEISENKNNYLTNDNKPGTTQGSKKTVKPIPLFSRQKRTGLSERKIDSRALQSKASVNVAKNADNLRKKRETTTNQSSQASNLVVSKTKLTF